MLHFFLEARLTDESITGEICVSAFPLQTPTDQSETGVILPDKAYSTAVYMGADLGPAKYFTKVS